jgi:diaminohydroxyphosphoribosylaminopyrimidine deaminase/5-amino-6-(5-phosphoribosylamino)uracil reductase
MTPLDRTRLQEALALAQTSIGHTEPNPRVGCVIGSEDGTVFGRGATQPPGQAHAEVMALRDAQASGAPLRGATAWVTLEPCAHFGRTPPCCDALVAAGLARVVVAVQDPFPQVAGAGLARLRAAGIRVDMADADIADAAWDLNIGFFSRVLRQRPWVRVKVAATLDGRTALDNGKSQWITGPAARADGHAWRARASAILTGVGTVLADDPRLDVRLVPSVWQPLRVVVDSQLRTPASARVLAPPGQTVVATALDLDSDRSLGLQSAGAEVIQVRGSDGQVGLPQLLAALADRQVNELHVEAGPTLNAALAHLNLVDEWLFYLAPKLVGPGRGVLASAPLSTLEDALQLVPLDTQVVGQDLRLRFAPAGGLRMARPLPPP